MEDNRADVFLIQEALAAANLGATIHFVQDGERAIEFFERADRDEAAPRPDLLILDINLPKKHGGEVLKHMRASRCCGHAKVLVVTSSDSARDRDAMANLGADVYFRKPSEYDEFMKLGPVAKALLETTPAEPS